MPSQVSLGDFALVLLQDTALIVAALELDKDLDDKEEEGHTIYSLLEF